MNLISLFTGGGGLDLGFEAAGFKCRAAVDNMPEAVLTLLHNNPKRPVFGPPSNSGDVNDINGMELLNLAGLKPGEVDMMIGGPPCQPFSVAAAQRFLRSDGNFKRTGFENEEKGKLIFRYAQLICEVKPKAFLIENVPGILSIDGGTGISVVYETLAAAGYTMSEPFVINARDYGVPQSRKRAFVIGTLNGVKVPPPTATHGGHLPYVTVSEALLGASRLPLNNSEREHNETTIVRYSKMGFGEREKLGRVDRLDPSKPSKTIIAGGNKGGGRSHLHPYIPRTLTVRESARLQTFPDNYEFLGKNGRQFTLVGNAVPPLLGEVLARHIGALVFGLKFKNELVHGVQNVGVEQAKTKLLVEALKDKSVRTYESMQ